EVGLAVVERAQERVLVMRFGELDADVQPPAAARPERVVAVVEREGRLDRVGGEAVGLRAALDAAVLQAGRRPEGGERRRRVGPEDRAAPARPVEAVGALIA